MKAEYAVGEKVFFKRHDGSVWSSTITEAEFQFGRWAYWIKGYTGWVREEHIKRHIKEFSPRFNLNSFTDFYDDEALK